MAFRNPLEFVAALGLAAARELQGLREQLAAATRELAAARAYQAQLQARAAQDEACRQEAIDAAETWQDRALGAEVRAADADREVRRLARVLADIQVKLAAAIAQTTANRGRQ